MHNALSRRKSQAVFEYLVRFSAAFANARNFFQALTNRVV
jgi:hypothetical protein